MDKTLRLIDLIQLEILENVQEVLSESTGFATGIMDERGELITAGSNIHFFCSKYIRNTSTGRHRCAQCYREAVEKSLVSGLPEVVICHAGLVNVVFPILLHGQVMGMVVCGSVKPADMTQEDMENAAARCRISPLEYRTAIHSMKAVDHKQTEQAMRMCFITGGTLANIAYNQEMIYQNKKNLESVIRTRSDYFANMNHEIRTPMNAIIGLTEIALREDMSDSVYHCLSQIQVSGQSLLSIINDILDFSKIDAGNMEIEKAEYRLADLLQETIGIVAVSAGKKKLEFTVDVAPDIPGELIGDAQRIRQCLINILNNGVKFTQAGEVHLKIEYEMIADNQIELMIAVSDTGIGIKEEDKSKLFHSFQQLDSKRNRNVEGTGLGLAITKSLLALMDGSIYVESEYGKGSTFYMAIPQEIKSRKGLVERPESEPERIAVRVANTYIEKQLKTDLKRFAITYRMLEEPQELAVEYDCGVRKLIIEDSLLTPELQEYVCAHPELSCYVLCDIQKTLPFKEPNIFLLEKPVYCVNLIRALDGIVDSAKPGSREEKLIHFTAPEAKVLVVDDNEVNLAVAEGLLKPLKMQVDIATSGFQALDYIKQKQYHMIFMDHMMPEMDGIETTHKIREQSPEYASVPIIALTANAMEGTREMFFKEGMNDFVAKPVNFRDLAKQVLKWIPTHYILEEESSDENEETSSEMIQIEGINVAAALELMGTEELFFSILKEYYRTIRKKSNAIEEHFEKEDWKNYTIEVHALKSSSRQVGALELGDFAASLEQAGKDGDIGTIKAHTKELLEKYRSYEAILAPLFPEEEEDDRDKELIPLEEKLRLLQEMLIACDELDMDGMESVTEQMSNYRFEGAEKERFEQLKEAVDALDSELIEKIVNEWVC